MEINETGNKLTIELSSLEALRSKSRAVSHAEVFYTENFNDLKTAGIYFLFDDKKNLLYVGQSTNVLGRLKTHLSPNTRLKFVSQEKIKAVALIEAKKSELDFLEHAYQFAFKDKTAFKHGIKMSQKGQGLTENPEYPNDRTKIFARNNQFYSVKGKKALERKLTEKEKGKLLSVMTSKHRAIYEAVIRNWKWKDEKKKNEKLPSIQYLDRQIKIYSKIAGIENYEDISINTLKQS